MLLSVELNGNTSTSKFYPNQVILMQKFLNQGSIDYVCNSFFITKNLVQDVQRYYAKISNNTCIDIVPNESSDYRCSRFLDLKPESEKSSIVILLESPHKDEYCYSGGGFMPIAPAQGKTGKGIELHLKSKINNGIKSRKLKITDPLIQVILMNPVQWQTSLYFLYNDVFNLHASIRNMIWKKLWNLDDVKMNFNMRLQACKPIIIINACTGGKSEYGLKSLVQKEIESNYGSITQSENHPSIWR